MTKIDTKEWLEASNEYTLDDYERAFAFMCKSYDEAQKEIEKMESVLYQIKYCVKSCRAGDGDNRTWEQCAKDCESLAEDALNDFKKTKP